MTYSVLGIDTQTGQRVNIFKLPRLLGLYIIGMQRMGKSGLFEELIIQDIKQNIGLCVLDPHGELIDHIIARLPKKKAEKKVILLDLTDEELPFGLNLFECSNPTNDSAIMKPLRQVLHTFEKAFGISPTTPLMYDLLYKTAYVLIANPGFTMVDIPLFLTNEACRKKLVANVTDPYIRKFWDTWDDPKQKSSKERQVADSYPLLNKLNDFLHAPLHNIIGQSQSTIKLQEIMDEGKILLIKLSRQLEQATSLIGSIIVALILNAADTRTTNKLFNLYADEFQNFATEDFAILLEQSPKRGIGVTMAHQNRAQLETSDKQAEAKLRARTLNVGNLIVLRVPTDAHELAGQFDNTPIRTKKVLKQRTEPKYKEWDEYYWDSEEAERQYNDLEQRIKEAYQQKLQAIIRAMCAQALADHFRNAFSKEHYHTHYYDSSSFAEIVADLKQCEVDDAFNRSALYNGDRKEAISKYLYHPLNPFWLLPDGALRTIHYTSSTELGWTEGDLNEVERNLVLRDMQSETMHDVVYYGRDKKGSGKYVECRLTYSYEKRVEWYSFTGEAAISGLEYVLRHGFWPSVITKEFPHWKGTTYSDLIPMKQDVAVLFYNLLEELIAEVHAFVAPFYERSWLKFHPNLAPDNIEEIRTSNGIYKEDVPHLTWPPLVDHPQLKIGQQRNSMGWSTTWMKYGRWEPLTFSGAESWVLSLTNRLQEQVKQSEQAFTDCENKRRQLLDGQKEFESQHHKTAHRREYLGEQPVKDQQISYRGEYSRITDVQWYDYQEELDQTHDQRRDEIANELAQLPKYTARVKLTDEKDTVVEYVITTMKPGTGLYGRLLQERIDRIREQNIQDGYLRDRTEAEKEIRLRQEQYSQPPQEPPISRRQTG